MKTVREIILEAQKEEAANLAIFNRIREALKGWEGKNITKRMETCLQKEFNKEPDAPTVSIRMEYGSLHQLNLYGGFAKNNVYSPFTLLLRHEGSYPEFSMERFNELNTQYTKGAPERQAHREIDLGTETPEAIQNSIDRFKAAQKELQDLLEMIEDRFAVQEEYGIKNGLRD